MKYVDESGNDVAESATLTGYYGDTYTAEAKTIEGWELITVPDNVSGTFSDTGQTVVFVYQRQLSLWGTVPWDYDEVSKQLRFMEGLLGLWMQHLGNFHQWLLNLLLLKKRLSYQQIQDNYLWGHQI